MSSLPDRSTTTIERVEVYGYDLSYAHGSYAMSEGRVLDTAQKPISGLYAAGELVGGLFYFNYPGGTGLVSGSVFGKIAGANAGTAALKG